MAFYYVKDDGTATGDAGRYASQQTGSFATLGTANYYASITAAIAATTSPVAGDFINPSDLHDFSSGGSEVYTGVVPSPYYIQSVDDANVDAARTTGDRGKETVTGSSDITCNNSFISGMSLVSDDNIAFTGGTGNTLQDCALTVTGATDLILIAGDGVSLTLINSEVNLNNATSSVLINGCASWHMLGGSINGASTGHVLLSGGFVNGGATVHIAGVDMSTIDGTLLANVGASESVDDAIDVRFDMCKLASGVAFTNETFKSKNQRALFTRCSDSSTLAEHQYHLTAFGGDVDDDSTIRRADDDAFEDSGTIVSYKIVTNSDASLGSPLWLDFPNPRYAELSTGAEDTLRLHIASTSALTDADIYVELSYPDGTNKQTPNFLSSAPTTVGGTLDLLASGTTLTTDSGSDWRDGGSPLAGHNEYLIDISTSGDVGADTVPVVRVYITKPSVTIQLGSTIELN